MAKNSGKTSVEVTTVQPKKGDSEKPKAAMFISGPLQIPSSFSFTKEEFIKKFAGKKLGGKDINDVYEDYQAWCKKNK